MTNLVTRIKGDTTQAMKSKDKEKLSTLRLLIAELEKEKIENKLDDVGDLADEQVEAVISRQIKKLDKEIEAYLAVGRTTDSQDSEKELLISYLPKQLTDEELLEVIKEIARVTKETGNNIGFAMKEVSRRVKGIADMGKASKMLKEQL